MALYRYDSYLGPHLNMYCTLIIQKGHQVPIAHRAQATINRNSATRPFIWDPPNYFSERVIATLFTKFGEIQKVTIARDKSCGLLRHSGSQEPGRCSHTAATPLHSRGATKQRTQYYIQEAVQISIESPDAIFRLWQQSLAKINRQQNAAGLYRQMRPPTARRETPGEV